MGEETKTWGEEQEFLNSRNVDPISSPDYRGHAAFVNRGEGSASDDERHQGLQKGPVCGKFLQNSQVREVSEDGRLIHWSRLQFRISRTQGANRGSQSLRSNQVYVCAHCVPRRSLTCHRGGGVVSQYGQMPCCQNHFGQEGPEAQF